MFTIALAMLPGGVHWRESGFAGRNMAQRVTAFIWANHLRPLGERASELTRSPVIALKSDDMTSVGRPLPSWPYEAPKGQSGTAGVAWFGANEVIMAFNCLSLLELTCVLWLSDWIRERASASQRVPQLFDGCVWMAGAAHRTCQLHTGAEPAGAHE